MRSIRVLLVAAALVGLGGPAAADLVKVEFDALVFYGAFPVTPYVDTVSGTIIYDTETDSFPNPGGDDLFDAIIAYTVTVHTVAAGDITYELTAGTRGRILTENQETQDSLGFSTIPGGLTGPDTLGEPDDAFVILTGAAPDLLEPGQLPSTVSLADFPSANTLLIGVGTDGVLGILTSLEGAPLPDTDGDGVPDEFDACPNSDLRPTVVIGECDTGVENTLYDDGCTLADLIAMTAIGAGDRRAVAAAIADLLVELVQDELVDPEDVGALMACVAVAL